MYIHVNITSNASYSIYVLKLPKSVPNFFHSKLVATQVTFTCSKSAIETQEKGVKYVQS